MMHILLVATVIIGVLYVVLLLAYRIGWGKQRTFIVDDGYTPKYKLSVIVPARNEADNIAKCIDALLAQQYPKHLYEIIVVDDSSEDDTAAIVDAYISEQVRCIRMAEQPLQNGATVAYKKAALSAGIAMADGDYIVTTDADCVAPDEWLMNIDALCQRDKPVMIVAPVVFADERSVVGIFQQLDFMSMQGITAATHALKLGNMSNGANLVFSKAAFDAVGGYQGIDHLATGDDYLLMVKMNLQYPKGISYLKSKAATVSTPPQPNWSSFFAQRVRWASKSGKYSDPPLTSVLVLVYLFNIALLVVGIACCMGALGWGHMLIMLAAKTIVELFFLYPVAGFFGRRGLLVFFPLMQPLHIGYIVFAGLMGFVGGYKWKGRNVR